MHVTKTKKNAHAMMMMNNARKTNTKKKCMCRADARGEMLYDVCQL